MNQKICGIQYQLLSRFYGVEEYIDYAVPLYEQVNCLTRYQDEFSLIRKILDLDIWYSDFYHKHHDDTWDPFTEPFMAFVKHSDSDFIFARYLPVKQYKDDEILDFIK